MNRIAMGSAPCGQCGTYSIYIPVLVDTKESDGEGGWWYQVDGNEHCPVCGEPMRWYHVAANPIYELLSLPVAEDVKEEAHVPDPRP